MPRLVDQSKVEKAVDAFYERIASNPEGDETHYDVSEWDWAQVAVGFFIGFGLDAFEIDRALEICRARRCFWAVI